MSIEQPTSVQGIVKIPGRPKPYCVRYRQNGKSRRQSFRTLEEAKNFKIDTSASLMTGHFIDPAARLVTVGSYAEAWAAAQPWRENTRLHRRYVIAKHIIPTFGDLELARVERMDVQAWVTRLMDKGHTPATIDSLFNVLNAIFNSAVREGKLAKSPSSGVKRPKRSKQVDVVLTKAEVARLAANLPERQQLMVWLGAWAGLRIGEALGLTMADVDTDKCVITVRRQLTKKNTFAIPKTDTRADIPVSRALIDRITAHVDAYGVSSMGTILSSGDRPISHQSVYARIWPKATKGLALHEDCDTFHALRHHFASTLIDEGLNAKIVQRCMRHATTKETFDTYGHLFDHADDAARDAISAAAYGLELRAVS